MLRFWNILAYTTGSNCRPKEGCILVCLLVAPKVEIDLASVPRKDGEKRKVSLGRASTRLMVTDTTPVSVCESLVDEGETCPRSYAGLSCIPRIC